MSPNLQSTSYENKYTAIIGLVVFVRALSGDVTRAELMAPTQAELDGMEQSKVRHDLVRTDLSQFSASSDLSVRDCANKLFRAYLESDPVVTSVTGAENETLVHLSSQISLSDSVDIQLISNQDLYLHSDRYKDTKNFNQRFFIASLLAVPFIASSASAITATGRALSEQLRPVDIYRTILGNAYTSEDGSQHYWFGDIRIRQSKVRNLETSTHEGRSFSLAKVSAHVESHFECSFDLSGENNSSDDAIRFYHYGDVETDFQPIIFSASGVPNEHSSRQTGDDAFGARLF